MKKETTKTPKNDVKPVVNIKRRPSKSATLKTAKVAVDDVPKVIEQPPAQQTADAVAVIPPSESVILQDSTKQITVAAIKKSAKITKLPPEPQATETNSTKHPTESKVLRERLGLIGYITETVKLLTPIEILGSKAEGVVFAKQIIGADRVLLHVTLVDGAGKRSIVSSRKKVPQPEWQALTASLTGMAITWRDKELKRAAK